MSDYPQPWQPLYDLAEKIKDEQSFLRFFTALREDFQKTERECRNRHGHICVEQGHWETRSVGEFLRSAEDWGVRGDFGEGVHHGEPMLRRIAYMLLAGRFLFRESDSGRRDDDFS
jgi:hypothetical protein